MSELTVKMTGIFSWYTSTNWWYTYPPEKYYGLLRFMRRHGGSERPPHPSELRTLRVIADKVKPRQNLYEMPAGAPLIQKHENQP